MTFDMLQYNIFLTLLLLPWMKILIDVSSMLKSLSFGVGGISKQTICAIKFDNLLTKVISTYEELSSSNCIIIY